MNPIDEATAAAAAVDSGADGSEGTEFKVPLPDLSYLVNVVKRNFIMSVLIIAVLAPMALITVLGAKSTYESTLVIHYDNNDVLDFESAAGRGNFPLIVAFMKLKLTDIEFMEELAATYHSSKKPSFIESLPLPDGVRRILKSFTQKPSSSAAEITSLAMSLMDRITITFDPYAGGQTPMLRISAIAGSSTEAQKLANAAGKLLSDYYYADELRRAGSKSAYFTAMLAKPMVRDLVSPSDQGNEASRNSAADNRHRQAEGRLKNLQSQERIRELTASLGTTRLRRTKLEQEVDGMALRYGPFHPKMTVAKRELLEFTRTTNEKGLADQLAELQEQAVGTEIDVGTPVSGRRASSGAEEVVQGIPERLSLYLLKHLALEQQAQEPTQRMHLSTLGEATLASAPIKSQRKKLAAMAAGLILAIVTFIALAREALASKARDAWPVALRYRLQSLATIPKWVLKHHERLDLDAIKGMISNLNPETAGAPRRPSSKKNPALIYRRISHWIHTKRAGKVLLVLKGTEQPNCSAFIANLANIFSIDYSGRVLVIDFDLQDPIAGAIDGRAQGMADILTRRENWKTACQPRNGTRGYDLVQSATGSDPRMSELLSAASFRDFMAAVRKTYSQIFIIGFRADQFVENSSLLDQSNDVLIIVEANRSKFNYLSKLVGSLPKGGQHALVMLESPG